MWDFKTFITKMRTENNEQKVAKDIVLFLSNKYHAKVLPFQRSNNNYLIVSNNKFNIVITVCNTDKHRVIKIEEILIEKEYRNKGLGTEILKDIMKISKDNNCITGLWCEINNKRGFDYYSKLGFKLVNKRNDYWFEY